MAVVFLGGAFIFCAIFYQMLHVNKMLPFPKLYYVLSVIILEPKRSHGNLLPSLFLIQYAY